MYFQNYRSQRRLPSPQPVQQNQGIFQYMSSNQRHIPNPQPVNSWQQQSPPQNLRFREYHSPAECKSPIQGVSAATTLDNSVDKAFTRRNNFDSSKQNKEEQIKMLVRECTENTKIVISKYESLEKKYSSNLSRTKSELVVAQREMDNVRRENFELKVTLKKKDEEIGELKTDLRNKEKQVSLYKTRMFKLLELNEKLNDCIDTTLVSLTGKPE